MSPGYWKRLKERRLARSLKGVAARLAKFAATHRDKPMRQTRTVEITIRDSHRPMTIIRIYRTENDEGKWSRWIGIGQRPLAKRGISEAIGAYIE